MAYRNQVWFIIVLVLLLGGCIQRKSEKITKKDSPVSAELAAAVSDLNSYISDRPTDTGRINAYARQLRLKVYKFLAQSLVVEPADQYRAAYLLQSGELGHETERFLLARQLAIESADHGYEKARLLAAVCLDRYLVASGQPQKYGTQYRLGLDGRTIWYEYDTLTTDSERVEWHVPPIDSMMANPRTVSNLL